MVDHLKDASGGGKPLDAKDGLSLKAPIGGWLVSIADVPDPVFSGRILGDGFAIDPTDSILRAPFAGVVTSIHRAHHAVTLRAEDGAEVLMHIGLDTVALKGDGFTPHVAEGDRVNTGDPLISFDMDIISQLVRSMVVPVVLTNGERFTLTVPAVDHEIAAGDAVASIAAKGEATASSAGEAGGDATVVKVRVADPNGIHARPAGLIAEAAKTGAAEVIIRLGDRKASAASPVGLMLLGAVHNDELTIEAKGADGAEVANRIAALLGGPEATMAAASAPALAAAPEVVASPVANALPTADAPELWGPGVAKTIEGNTASPGLAVGVSVRITSEDFEVSETGADVELEIKELRAALKTAAADISAKIAASKGQQAEILKAHLSFVEDPDLRDAAWTLIRDGKSAGYAWKTAIDRQVAALRKLGNPVLAERASDLEDVRRRVLAILLGVSGSATVLPDNAIIFAADLLPSQFADLDLTKVAGIVLAYAGPTAHVSILAASKGIPAVVAAGVGVVCVPDGQPVILDADQASVRINPPEGDLADIRATVIRRRERLAANRAATQDDCYTADGKRIEVVANLGGPADVAVALEGGAEGCGLMRSEFLFLNRTTAPSEDEQYAQYQAIADGLKGRPLIIRTLDAGADKDVPYANLPKEENPALGLRGVRMSLWQPELLRTQIRALLRVKPYGQCKILLPMIATIADLRDVRKVIDEETKALGRTTPIEVGIMVEVPSAALISKTLAAEADFLSVGTNDLAQYTLAIDRVNPRLAKQLDPFHPAVLRLIQLAVEGAKAHGRWVGVCGSLSSFPLAAPVLIGLGVTELSATSGSIAEIKAMVRTLDMNKCKAVAEAALALESGEAVRRMLAQSWPEA
ncbi:phosphoenolpyruvate--protein phosphotransferase [Pleomorphomonas sp. PLEO]|uniref:phosphoenolpyruvate--protein phosphotransferase n=1 Tax=Pleomorphomonas sp. PLEO TaxID=3239306 RepID=UPI00351E148F